MAGSYNHATNNGIYRGVSLLENMGDMTEAVEEMWFMIHHLAQGDQAKIQAASDEYFKCLRGETPWPEAMKPGIEE
jgi:hypothetical protein